MTRRMFAASSFAVLGIGLMLASVEASARSGGFATGRAISIHGGFRPSVVRPSMPEARPAVSGGAAVRIHGFRTTLLHHRRSFHYGVPLAVSGAPARYGMEYSPAIYPVPYDQPADDPSALPVAETGPAPRHISIIVRPSGCNSQTLKVPSESGGERTITVVRC